MELTHIDQHLNGEQKKRIAKFFREEAAKRTKYDIEPTWTMPESVLAIKKEECTHVQPEITEDEEKESVQKSPTSNLITNGEEPEPGEADTLEIAASPLPESDSEQESSSPSDENPESELVKSTLQTLWEDNQGAYSNLKEKLFVAKKYIKGLEGVSKTQIKKQMYKEKTKQIKALKRQHQQ